LAHYLQEFAHLLIFVLAITLCIQAMFLVWARKHIVEYWDILDPDDISDVQSMELLIVEHKAQMSGNPGLKERKFLRDKMEYFFFKFLFFAHCERIPNDFDMVWYLDQCFVIEIVGLLEVRRSTWGKMVVALAINFIWTQISQDFAPAKNAFMAFIWVLQVAVIGLLYYVGRVIPLSIIESRDFKWKQAEGVTGYGRVMQMIVDKIGDGGVDPEKSHHPNPFLAHKPFLLKCAKWSQALMVTTSVYFSFFVLYFKVFRICICVGADIPVRSP
jgi:hypothetical protein